MCRTNRSYESFLRWEAMIARQVARRKGCSVEDLYKKQHPQKETSDWFDNIAEVV